jgi:hypothetical protein
MAALQKCRDILLGEFQVVFPPSRVLRKLLQQSVHSCNYSAKPQLFRCVKKIVVILTIATSLAITACSLFAPTEASRHESGRTVFRATEETPVEVPDVASAPQKVPGEHR